MPTAIAPKRPPLPSDDKRWKILDATMRRHGYAGHSLIECLHQAQESFGFLDETTMRFVSGSLNVPLSKVFGVSTFYHFFQLKPQGEHTCVVCLGTACYIKGGQQVLETVGKAFDVEPGQTTSDKKLSLLAARCIGACALAPASVLDGEVLGKAGPAVVLEKTKAKVAQPKVDHAA
ncbi:MAG: bidirectional hydrogenase complex protein HoxE [Tepidisphaeraceae bacterium]